MKPAWIAALAFAFVVGILAGDFLLLHWPFVRNGPITYAALLVPIAIALGAIRLARTALTLGALAADLLLAGGYVAARTVLLKLPEAGPAARADQPATDFTLLDEKGRTHTMGGLRGSGRLVLVFFRGHW